METKAVSRFVRVAPRKARIVVDLVRGKSVEQAREILAFCDRAAAENVTKTLNSAVANAEHNNHLRAKGSASRINKRTCHITIVVAPREEA